MLDGWAILKELMAVHLCQAQQQGISLVDRSNQEANPFKVVTNVVSVRQALHNVMKTVLILTKPSSKIELKS